MTADMTRSLILGQLVFCTVRGNYFGWQMVRARRESDGYIRIAGFHAWCPPHNFALTDPRAPLAPPPASPLAGTPAEPGSEGYKVYGSRHASED